jgi:hypothetical protein
MAKSPKRHLSRNAERISSQQRWVFLQHKKKRRRQLAVRIVWRETKRVQEVPLLD